MRVTQRATAAPVADLLAAVSANPREAGMNRLRYVFAMPLPTRMFVYEKALEATAACEAVARHIPAYRPDLVDQLRRAATSIPLNIAEGAAEFSPKEKVRFYRIARRSASECGAILDVMDRVLPEPPSTVEARRGLTQVLALLTRTMKAVEGRQR